MTFPQRLQQSVAGLFHRFSGSGMGSSSQGLPVNLGEYGMAGRVNGRPARMQSVDQALVWVVVALLNDEQAAAKGRPVLDALIEWLVLRSRPTKPCELAYTLRLVPVPSDAPSELLMRASASRPACSQANARSMAPSASMAHGCQLSNSRRSVAIRSASARPDAGSASVWRAIAQACSTVARRLSACRSAVLALPLRWPK